jgi:hypothetical protein
MATVAVDSRDAPVSPPRWLLITAGILWLLISLVVLSMDATSVATIGYLVGFVLIFAGVDELIRMVVATGWRWLHGVLGVLFIIAGFGALLEPFQTFGVLALFMGWYLLIKGFFDLAASIAFRDALPLWGLGLTAGILEILLGLWALGYPGRSAWLLLIWVGVGALLRGVGDLVAGFTHGGAR